MKLIVDHDPELFDKCAESFQKRSALAKQHRAKQEARWRMLEHKASMKEYAKYLIK